jgi:hypothetical protein
MEGVIFIYGLEIIYNTIGHMIYRFFRGNKKLGLNNL